MILVDVVLIAVLLIALIVGAQRGLVASAGTLLGLIVGGAVAYWLAPIVNDSWPWQEWRPLVVVALVLLLLGLGGAAGGAIGAAVRRGVDRAAPLRVVDRLLGAVASVVVAALAVSVVGSSVAASGGPLLAPAVASSQVLQTIDRLTPAPVAEAIAQLRSVVLDDALPAFGDLLDGTTAPTEPPVDLADPELARAAASVVRVSGTAYACGTSSTGSGFVIAPDRVITNAHVVAGVDAPVVEVPGGEAREGRIVAFDPAGDLAIIAVDGLDAAPLRLGPTLAPGSAAVVQGYPYGGPFTQINADVLSVGTVEIPDIYDRSAAPREIYSLQAAVRPGNSGGPLLTADGAVAGLVFARGENDDTRGYAITMAELDPVAATAASLDRPVSSGSCTG